MTVKAYLLIEAQVGKTKEVVEAIRKVQGVASVDAVTGPYDAIAIMEGKTLNGIGKLIVSEVHTIAGISRTVSCLVFSLA